MFLALAFLLAAPPEYVFVPDTKPYLMLCRHEWGLVGKLDSAGNFDPEWRHPPGSVVTSSPAAGLLNFGAGKPGYEFRSGRLIPGTLNKEGDFVPELGGKIIDFKEYRYSKDAPYIYNLPGRFELKK